MAQDSGVIRSGSGVMDSDQSPRGVSVELRNLFLGTVTVPSSGASFVASGLEQRETLIWYIEYLEQLVHNMSRQIETLQVEEQEDTPEILNLPPLYEKRVNVEIQKREPARFYFLEDSD